MANYFVRRQSKVFGPVIGQQIVALAKSGKIHPTDEIATDKNGPWQPATSFGPLQAAFKESSVDLQPLDISSLSSFQPNTQQPRPTGRRNPWSVRPIILVAILGVATVLIICWIQHLATIKANVLREKENFARAMRNLTRTLNEAAEGIMDPKEAAPAVKTGVAAILRRNYTLSSGEQ